MNGVLTVFLSLSLSGSLLILILFLCNALLKNRISRQWQYYIWLIAIARLLLPFAPETNLMGSLSQAVYQAAPAAPVQQAAPGPREDGGAAGDAAKPNQGGGVRENGANAPADPSHGSRPLREAASLLTQQVWLVWLGVALLLFVRKVTIYQSFARYVRAGRKPVSDTGLLDRLAFTGLLAGVKRPVELCVNPLLSSPLLIGFFHPCIVLPDGSLSEPAFQYTVFHELTHYRRRDMFYKWLVQITVCLHWFNPLVYLMGREINKACEFSCDEAVMARMGATHAQAYGKTLLDAMASAGSYRESLASVTLSENKRLLKERLCAIMRFQKPSGAIVALMLLLTIFLVFGASCMGVSSAANAGETHAAVYSSDVLGRQSLTLQIKSAAVEVEAATDGRISAIYDDSAYDVSIENKGGAYTVAISSKLKNLMNTENVRLYLPDIAYSDVKMDITNAYFTCSMIKAGSISGVFDTAAVYLTLPEGFAGSLNADVTGGDFELTSLDDFANTNTTIIDNRAIGEASEVIVPKGFQINGNTATYANGTQRSTIRVTRRGTGVVCVYSAKDEPDASFELPEFPFFQPTDRNAGWKDFWKDTWREPWYGGSGLRQPAIFHIAGRLAPFI